MLNKIYPNEPDTFEHGGVLYDVNKVYDLAKHAQTQHVHVEDLKWQIKGEKDREDRKIFTANLKQPILVTTFNGVKTVVGGLMELRSAAGEGIRSMLCYTVTQEMLDQCVVETTPANESYKPAFSNW